MILRSADLGVCRSQQANLRTNFRSQMDPIPRRVFVVRGERPRAPVQVTDLSVLDEAFRVALDCPSGGQVCTKLTQLRTPGTSSPTGTAAISRLVGQRPGQAAFCALDSGQQLRRPIGNELGHDVARSVPRFDLGDSIRRADRLAIGRSRQIAVPQGIAECPALVGKDGHQVADPAKLGFQDRVGMPGNQRSRHDREHPRPAR